MTTPAITAEELSGLLGDVEATAIQRIVDTGASIDEVGEALSELEAETRTPSSARVLEVKRILEELVPRDGVATRVRSSAVARRE